MELKIIHQIPTGKLQYAYYFVPQENSIIRTHLQLTGRCLATLYPFSYRPLQAYIYIGWGSDPSQTMRLPISQHKNVPHFVPGNQNNNDHYNINTNVYRN